MQVAIVGGGPAGACAAAQLASAGVRTILLEEKLAWEKPCGGGLTYRAYQRFPFLLGWQAPCRQVREVVFQAPGTDPARLWLRWPMLIYSRRQLNGLLLERAARAGAEIERARVTAVERGPAGWRIQAGGTTVEASFCVVANGARNCLRGLGIPFRAADVMYALGYYVEATQQAAEIAFLAGLRGYIWVFPRVDHLSVGICGKGEPALALRERLEQFLERRGLPYRHSCFYAHVLPSLETGSWSHARLAGSGWIAAGDAAGLVDPITGEGIYYAMRSGELAAQALIEAGLNPDRAPARYIQLLERDFLPELEFASRIAPRVYAGQFLGGTVPQRAVQFLRYSARFREVMQDLLAGLQPYTGLKQRLYRNLRATLQEVVLGFFFQRLLPGEQQG